jgi:hypothetical protein
MIQKVDFHYIFFNFICKESVFPNFKNIRLHMFLVY